MDRNYLLALGLSFLVFTVWLATQPAPKRATPPGKPATEAPAQAPATGETGPLKPEGSAAPSAAPAPSATSSASSTLQPEAPAAPERTAELKTDLVHAQLTTRGGGLAHWELSAFDDAYLPGRPPVDMVAFDPSHDVGLFTPLGSLELPDQRFAPYLLEKTDEHSVAFVRTEKSVTVRKTYSVEPGSYLLHLRIEVTNGGTETLHPTFQVGWPIVGKNTHDWAELSLTALVDGSHEQMRLGKGGAPQRSMFSSGKADAKEFPSDVEWAAADTRYFVAALIPEVPNEAGARLSPASEGHAASVEVAQRAVTLPPGQSAARDYRVYLGPKQSPFLEAAGAHLDRAVVKGWFPPLTNFFTAVLTATHRVIPNYGIAIIVVTIVVRMLMFPVMQRQMRSMKRMSVMSPRLKEIQEQYKDDKERQSQEMMKLYKESGFNPLTGCLPMFLQLPVFIGLYYALQGAIALRQEPFFGWIHDLSAPEMLFTIPGLDLPVRLLPILMGGSMVLQSRLTPTTVDPAQARMMNTIMPVMFTFMFYQFASGLVLYWLVSNLLGIVQQLVVNRNPKQ